MATLYWGGGSGTWNTSTVTNWYSDLARTVPAGVAPTYADSVIFDSASNATLYTVTMANGFVGTGSITGTVLTITAVTSGTLAVGQSIVSSVATYFGGTYIVSLGTGTGGIGTYNVSISQTIASGTITAVPACLDITVSGPASGSVTFSSTGALMVYGNMSLPATGMTSSVSGSVFFVATTTKTITANAVTWTTGQARFDGVGGDWTLGSAITIGTTANSGGINVYRGTFRTGNFNATSAALTSNSGLTRAVYLGSSTVTLNTTNNSALAIASTAGLTWDAGTSTIVFSGTSGVTAAGAGLTFNNVNCTSTTNNSAIAFTGANTFANLSVTSLVGAGIKQISFDSNTTITGTLTLGASNAATSRILVRSAVPGTQITITAAAIGALSDVDFRDIAAGGAAAPWSGTRLGDCLNNGNITFPASKTVYWNLAAGGSWSSVAWASTPLGTPDNTTNFPLAQDNVIIGETGLNSGATVGMAAGYQAGNIDMSSRTTPCNYSMSTFDTNLLGNLLLGPGTSITGGNGILFFNGYGRQQYFETQNKTFDCPITLNCASSNVIISNNLVMGSTRSFTVNYGNLAMNGYGLSAGSFVSTGTGARGVRVSGGSNITVTGNNGTVVNMGTATSFSVDGSPLRLYLNYSGATGTRTISIGAPTAPIVKNRVNMYITAGTDIIAGALQAGDLDFTGFSGTLSNVARTINGNLILSPTMTVVSGATAQVINGTGDNLTITTNNVPMPNPLTFTALTSNVAIVGNMNLVATGYTLTLTSGNISIDGYTVTAGLFSSSGAVARSINFGTTGSMVITGGNTTVWNTGTVTGFGVTGTPNVYLSNVTTLPTDTRTVTTGTLAEAQSVNFIVSGPGNLTTLAVTRDLDLGGFTGNLVNAAHTVYGNLIIGAGAQVLAGTNATTFAKTTGTQQVITNGQTIDLPITINGAGGTVRLLDNLAVGATRTVTHTNGTLDLNGATLNVGTGYTTAAGTKSITFNGGTILCPASSTTAFNNAVPTGFTTSAGSAPGVISMTGATAKTFVGGGSSYAAALDQAGAGALTITGANTFSSMRASISQSSTALIQFTAGTTTTFTDGFEVDGTTANPITISSATAATHTLSLARGTVVANYLNLFNSTATGGAAWYAGGNSTNGGNNSGWLFIPGTAVISIGQGITIGRGVSFT